MHATVIYYSNYADDTQIYTSISPGDYGLTQTWSMCIYQIND